MKKLFIVVLVVIFSSICLVAQAQDVLKYNPFDGSWSYENVDSQLNYNPFEGSWEWAE